MYQLRGSFPASVAKKVLQMSILVYIVSHESLHVTRFQLAARHMLIHFEWLQVQALPMQPNRTPD